MSKRLLFILSTGLVLFLVTGTLLAYYFSRQPGLLPFSKNTSRLKNLPSSSVNAPSLIEQAAIVERVEDDSIAPTLENGETHSFLLASSRVYVVYKNKPGVKAGLVNLNIGQKVTVTTEKDELGIEVIKTIVIEE